MAIAFDNSSVGPQVNASSLTYSHTTGSGSNRILWVTVQGSPGSDLISGVTYNSIAMTLMDKGQYNPTSGRWSYLFYLIAPATGANNVVVSASALAFIGSASASYTGANQTGQPDAQNKNIGTGNLTTTLTTVADNSWTVLGNANDGGSPTAGAGTTLRQSDGSGFGLFDSNGAITPAGSTSLTANIGGAANMINIMASFSPAGGVSTNFLSSLGVGS